VTAVALTLATAFVFVGAVMTGGTDRVVPAKVTRGLPQLYILHCSGCHRRDGASLPSRGIPDLRLSGLYADTAEGRQYLVQVPGVSQSRLDNAAAAELLTWALREFSSKCLPANFRPFTAAEVARWRSAPVSDVVSRRAALRQQAEAGAHRCGIPYSPTEGAT